MENQRAVIRVQREWNAWRTAELSIDDLEEIHWLQPAGAPHALLHAYVSCARLANTDVPYDDCLRTPGPHRVLVCVLKRHHIPSVYAEIERRAAAFTFAS
jgi:hypothetical protein